MKSFACVVLLAAVVVAEPPSFRQNYRFQRQEVESEGPVEAPYPAAGFRPAKAFNLPTRQQTAPPATSYGVPDDSYQAPVNTYGVPQAPDTEYGVPEETTTEAVENLKTEDTNEKLEEAPKNDAEVVSSEGSYYILLPGSQLQRVQFQTENDVRNMAYTARLQYKSEDRAPLYVYTAVPQYQPSAAYVQLY